MPIETVKYTYNLKDVGLVAQALSKAIRKYMGDNNFRYDNLLVSMPRHFNTALGWYMSGQTISSPTEFRGVKIIPAYDNQITVFCPDCIEIKSVSIDLNNPSLYA